MNNVSAGAESYGRRRTSAIRFRGATLLLHPAKPSVLREGALSRAVRAHPCTSASVSCVSGILTTI